MGRLWVLLIGGKGGSRVERLGLHVSCRVQTHALPQQKNMRYFYLSISRHINSVAVVTSGGCQHRHLSTNNSQHAVFQTLNRTRPRKTPGTLGPYV